MIDLEDNRDNQEKEKEVIDLEDNRVNQKKLWLEWNSYRDRYAGGPAIAGGPSGKYVGGNGEV